MRLLAAVLAMALASCDRPPLRVVKDGRDAVVDVQTLGEYKTTIWRLRLSLAGKAIWEAKARRPGVQIHTFRLQAGVSERMPKALGDDDFELVVPQPGESFVIREGAEYLLEVWGGDSEISRATATVRF